MLGFALRKASGNGRGSDRPVGLDVTASRVVAVGWEQGAAFPLALDPLGPTELALLIRLDVKPVQIGAAAAQFIKKLPHVVCGNFLSSLGKPREWVGERLRLTPETALGTIFATLAHTLSAEAGTVVLSLPAYLPRTQAQAAFDLAAKSGLPVAAMVFAPLAVAARRAGWLLGEQPSRFAERPVLSLASRMDAANAAGVVIVDVDDHALCASYVSVEPAAVQLHGVEVVSRAAERLWRERLLEAVSDRCIRKCRRDPRDSAEAEQGLWDQLIHGLDAARAGRPLTLNIRSKHWYQDLTVSPEDMDDWCLSLAQLSAEAVRNAVEQANAPWPPRAVWLSDEASRLPGLATALHNLDDGRLDVQSLPPHAAAEGAVVLTNRLTPGLHDRSIRGPWGTPRMMEPGRNSG